MLLWQVLNEGACETVHDSVKCIIFVSIAVEFVAHYDSPVRFEPVSSRLQIALAFKECVLFSFVSVAEIVENGRVWLATAFIDNID